MAKRLKLVWNWHKMDRTCTRCGEKLSVKYDVDNKPYCNLCVGKAEEGENGAIIHKGQTQGCKTISEDG